jgi:DMSO/TMAO reductase YedYZ molybdopterin-dependent catalytic subunit
MITPGKLKFCLLFTAIFLVRFSVYAADTILAVTGEVKTPIKLTLTELQAMPAEKVIAKDHDGTTCVYEGVPLHTILHQAGVPQGELLKGDALQLCVLVKAADGYKAVFSLSELDPLFTDKKILLAYTRDGAPLDAKAGPLRLVIPDEKRQARWVRQVKELEIMRVGSSK